MLALDGEFFKLVVLLENAETWDGVLLCWLVRRGALHFGHDGGWDDEGRVAAESEIIEAVSPQHLPVFTHPLGILIAHPPTVGFALHL